MNRRRPRDPARLAAALLCLALAMVSGAARGVVDARVYDAPAAALPQGKGEAATPPTPPEYLTEDLGWIELAYHPSTRERVRALIARAPGIRADLGALLGREPFATKISVRIAALPAELDNLAPVELGASTAAAFGGLHLAVMSAAPRLTLDPPDLEAVFRHELTHLALDEATDGAPVPRWLHEGIAVHAAHERAALRAQTLCVASLRARLIPLGDVDASLFGDSPQASIASAEAADFARFLLEGDRARSFAVAVDALRAGATLDDALTRAYGSSLATLELAWRGDVARRYGFMPVLAGSLLVFGLVLASGVALRRFRRREPEPPAPRRRSRSEPELRLRAGRSGAAQILAARGARRLAAGDGDRDAEVPKVEHNGQWHTLH